MDITGHFESASCVIEVDGSDTLAQVKRELLVELGVPHARRVGVRMKGGGDIGNDDLRICDTEMDEGCAVELYYTGANITLGLLPHFSNTRYSLTLSPCDKYLAVMNHDDGVVIFDTETHERLCCIPTICSSVFSPCSEWISSVNKDAQCAEVHDVKTGALTHSFGDETRGTAWSPCGTKLLSWGSYVLQVWDIATGVVVHEWDHIKQSHSVMVVTGDKVAMFSGQCDIAVWDYTTGVKMLVLAGPSFVKDAVLAPSQLFIAASYSHDSSVRVWNIETGECVFEDLSENYWTDIAVSNDIVAARTSTILVLWSISTGEQLWHGEIETHGYGGLAISSCGGVVMHGGNEGVEIVDISHLS